MFHQVRLLSIFDVLLWIEISQNYHMWKSTIFYFKNLNEQKNEKKTVNEEKRHQWITINNPNNSRLSEYTKTKQIGYNKYLILLCLMTVESIGAHFGNTSATMRTLQLFCRRSIFKLTLVMSSRISIRDKIAARPGSPNPVRSAAACNMRIFPLHHSEAMWKCFCLSYF